MATKTTVLRTNPYRPCTKLHTIFRFMADGTWHSIRSITKVAYYPGAEQITYYRRRVASALRTIRSKPNFWVGYNGAGSYRLMTWNDRILIGAHQEK